MKDISNKCILIIIAEGFEEAEAVAFLSQLRQAGLCVKSVSQISGLVGSAHGVWFMPDLNLAELERLNRAVSIDAAVLPGGHQSLTRLESDPRVCKLLRQVVANRGYIITGQEGLRVVRTATMWCNEPSDIQDCLSAVILRETEESLDSFIRNLIRRLQPPRS